MNLYSTFVFIHVVAAIFGLGPLATLAIDATPTSASPRGLSALRWTMCGLVAAITYLMEAKPW